MKMDKLIKSLYIGIPDSLRGEIWMHLAKSVTVALNHDQNVFYKLIEMKNEEIENNIKKDVTRTNLDSIDPSNKIKSFLNDKRKKKLFNILKAYAIYDNQVGYCQGTNNIVALMMYNIQSERCVFWTFIQLMYDKNWRNLYLNNTPKLLRMMELFVEQLKLKLNDLYLHFINTNILPDNATGAFSHFFISIFSYEVPLEYSNRVMDLFWVYEEKIIFECLIHLLRLKKDMLMSMNFEDSYVYCKKELVKDCIKEFGIEKSLPILINFEEREVII